MTPCNATVHAPQLLHCKSLRKLQRLQAARTLWCRRTDLLGMWLGNVRATSGSALHSRSVLLLQMIPRLIQLCAAVNVPHSSAVGFEVACSFCVQCSCRRFSAMIWCLLPSRYSAGPSSIRLSYGALTLASWRDIK